MPTTNNTALIVPDQLGAVVGTWGGDCVRFPSSFILRTRDSSQLPRLGSPSGGHLDIGDQELAGGGHIYPIKISGAWDMLQTSAIAGAWAEDSTCEE